MIINLTEENLLGASERANIRDLLSQGDIPIKLNTIVAGKISGSYRRNFVNWDGSELTDGTITGMLSSNLWHRHINLLLKYCNTSNDIGIDESTLTDISLCRLIEASDFDGRNPYDVSFIVNGIDVGVETLHFFALLVAVRLPRIGRLASLIAIAMACLGFFTTFLLEVKSPRLYSPMTLPTFFSIASETFIMILHLLRCHQ